jgi:hypothetical protein
MDQMHNFPPLGKTRATGIHLLQVVLGTNIVGPNALGGSLLLGAGSLRVDRSLGCQVVSQMIDCEREGCKSIPREEYPPSGGKPVHLVSVHIALRQRTTFTRASPFLPHTRLTNPRTPQGTGWCHTVLMLCAITALTS